MTINTDRWADDYNSLAGSKGDIWTTAQMVLGESESAKDYHEKFDNIFATVKDSIVAMTLLAVLMASQGMQQLGYRAGSDGSALKAQSDVVSLANDLEDLQNQDDQGMPAALHKTAVDADQIYHYLQSPEAQKELGSSTCEALASPFLALRQSIKDGSVPDQGTGTQYFCADGTDVDAKTGKHTMIDSYKDLRSFMAQKGDPFKANEAQKALTDADNQATQTGAGGQAAAQAKVNADNNDTTGIANFVNAILQAIVSIESTTQKNPK